jgi:hypothetical protein
VNVPSMEFLLLTVAQSKTSSQSLSLPSSILAHGFGPEVHPCNASACRYLKGRPSLAIITLLMLSPAHRTIGPAFEKMTDTINWLTV